MRDKIQFLRAGRLVTLDHFSPDRMLLDYLRETEGAKGTKEGCREGDCGACTVAVGRPSPDGGMEYQPVNSCILPLGSLDGCDLITIDDLAHSRDKLHPLQQAFVDTHASQCGFCTPGIIMALFTLYQAGTVADRRQVADQLAGNLCRCTGYRPILDAGVEALDGSTDQFSEMHQATARKLSELDGGDIFIGDKSRFFAAPESLDILCELAAKYPQATIVAGATDVGLWITKHYRDLGQLIYLGRVKSLQEIREDDQEIYLGAGVTYARAEDILAKLSPDAAELIRRIGSKQVRASGTIGGNVANGSPIGDMPPLLIALGAKLHLRLGTVNRTLNIEDFFIDYGKQDRALGEVLTGITIPKPADNQSLKAYKISKRFDQDISAIMMAALVTVKDSPDGAEITDCRTGFGGMAAIPKRASRLEQTLKGLNLSQADDFAPSAETVKSDFTPIDDMRASADYRGQVAAGLVQKMLIELSGARLSETRVLNAREEAHG